MRKKTLYWSTPLLLCLLALPLPAKDKAPEQTKSQLAFGVDMAERGLWSEALFRFKRAAQAEPGNPRILNNIAVAYEALGLFEKALDAYQDAIKVDPTNKDLKHNYSRFVEFYRNFKPDESKGGDAAKNAPPAGGTPAGGTPAGGTPAGGTPAGGTPAGGTPAASSPGARLFKSR